MNYRQPFEGDYGIYQGFGQTEWSKNHTGIDYLCPSGTPILASEEGTVIWAGWRDGGYGYTVFIKHPDDCITIYEHLLKDIPVQLNQKVSRSQVIGWSGSTGNSTGPHLHFEMHDANNKIVNPLYYLHSSIENPIPAPKPVLKSADELGENVEVVCTAGAKAWFDDFTKFDVLPQGTELIFTGETTEHNGYVYCECYQKPFWVAVHDNDTQILDSSN